MPLEATGPGVPRSNRRAVSPEISVRLLQEIEGGEGQVPYIALQRSASERCGEATKWAQVIWYWRSTESARFSAAFTHSFWSASDTETRAT